jgi:signal transduction histidine kinase
MKTSIFKRYFTITAVILLISMMVFSLILVLFLRNMWISEKNQLLQKNVSMISQYSEELFNYDNYMMSLSNIAGIVSQTVDADVYIVDESGNYVLCADRTRQCMHKGAVVSGRILKKTFSGNYSELGTLGGIYNENCYTVGSTLRYQGQNVGYVYASVPSSSMSLYLALPLQAIAICGVGVLLLSLLVVSVVTAKITKPIRLMTKAAENMEKGDFLQKIPIYHHDEIGQLSEAFNKMSKALASLESMRRNFSSSVSHELKTPMTTISGFVDGILDGTIEPENQEKYLKIVSDETKRLSRLVNSMLQMSRLESDSHKLNFTTFNFTDIVARTLISFEQKIDSKQLVIEGMDGVSDIPLFADRDTIYQVVYNLVDNAIKFTPVGGKIVINLDRGEGNVHFMIRNSGQGLSEHELSSIFERFYKTDRSRSEDKSGVGFGLYIVKTIIRQHGGEISASSVPGQYTQFDVRIPNKE